jgi:hypothetical protein
MNFIKFVSFFFFLRSHIIWILELKPKVISNLELELTSFENKQKEQCALYMWKPKLELQLFLCMKRLASTPWQRMHTLNFYTKMQWLKIAVGHRKDVLWQNEIFDMDFLLNFPLILKTKNMMTQSCGLPPNPFILQKGHNHVKVG